MCRFVMLKPSGRALGYNTFGGDRYTDFFHSVNARYDLSDDLVFRGAITTDANQPLLFVRFRAGRERRGDGDIPGRFPAVNRLAVWRYFWSTLRRLSRVRGTVARRMGRDWPLARI